MEKDDKIISIKQFIESKKKDSEKSSAKYHTNPIIKKYFGKNTNIAMHKFTIADLFE